MMCVSFCAYLTLDPHAGIIPLESPDRGLTTDRTLTAGDVGQHVCQQFVIDRLLQYCDYLDFPVRYVVVLLITIRHLIIMSHYVTMIHAETHPVKCFQVPFSENIIEGKKISDTERGEREIPNNKRSV